MKKVELNVPDGIKYISDWKDYHLPEGKCIVDKGVTGCGYTEFCLTNDENLVLCSPRRLLLENKRDQHLQDKNILYLENNNEDFQDYKEMNRKIEDHIVFCESLNLPVKFMVTYDSSSIIINYLEEHGLEGDFKIIVDEFQSIFLDSYFKAEVEFNFIDRLSSIDNVIYLSATPMLDKYLIRVPEFKDLAYQFIKWPRSVIEKVYILRKPMSSIVSACSEIIKDYRTGKYPLKTVGSKLFQSTEAVFYINSVADIVRIITKCGLKPSEAVIICSDTIANRRKLRRVGHKIGRIPLKGENNPMFIFCTRSVYIGADFYSNCASTFVFADPNLDHLALDISLDLPQIIGRQRLRENIFKNDIHLFYKTLHLSNILGKDKFDELQRKRKESTYELLDLYDRAGSASQKSLYISKLRADIQVSIYSRDFVSISSKTGLPVYNNFIELANERAWEVAQVDFQDNLTVTRVIEEVGYTEVLETEEDFIVTEFLNTKFYTNSSFDSRLRELCSFLDQYPSNSKILFSLKNRINDPKYLEYYLFFGSDGCKIRKYRKGSLESELRNISLNDSISKAIYSTFELNMFYSNKFLKQTLSEIFNTLGITDSPKATFFKKYFISKRSKKTVCGITEEGLIFLEKCCI